MSAAAITLKIMINKDIKIEAYLILNVDALISESDRSGSSNPLRSFRSLSRDQAWYNNIGHCIKISFEALTTELWNFSTIKFLIEIHKLN